MGMRDTLIALLWGGTLLAAPFAASAMIGRRFASGRAYLVVAFGVLGIGIVAILTFLGFWIAPAIGVVLCWLIIAASVVILSRAKVWSYWRIILPLATLTVAFATGYIALLYLWSTTADGFTLAATRFFTFRLPVDNYIPTLTAERLSEGLSTHGLVEDWNGSDRPPAQAGLILFAWTFRPPFLTPAVMSLGIGIAAQLTWIPALFAFLRSLRVARLSAYVGVVFAGFAGTTLVNTVFTWPKLISAAFVLVSALFLVDARARPAMFRIGLSFAVVSFALAMLAHGAAAFMLPLVIALGVAASRRQPVRALFHSGLAAVAAGLIVYLPWVLYQRLADPPGDRLLKWHLAGVMKLADSRSFIQALIDSYSQLTIGQWMGTRLANFGTVVNWNILHGLSDSYARRSAEFFTTSMALGLAFPMAGVIIATIVIQRIRGRRLSRNDRLFAALQLGSVGCIAFWCLVMYTPRSTIVHQGSQVWIFLLLVSPIIWVVERNRIIGAITLAPAFGYFLLEYAPGVAGASIRPAALLLAIASIAAVVGVVCFVWRQSSSLNRTAIVSPTLAPSDRS